MESHEKRKYELIFQDALGMLIKHHAFFGHIMANMVRVADSNVRVLSLSITSEGRMSLHYNLEDIKHEIEENKISLKNLTAMVQHTIYHLINEHFIRKVDGKYEKWLMTPAGPVELFSLASDIAINQYIQDLPESAVTLKTFEDALPPEENAEYYYKVLLKNAKDNKKDMENQMNGSVEFGDAEGALYFKSDEKNKEERDKQREEQMADMLDKLPFNKNEEKKTEGEGERQPGMNGMLVDDHTWNTIKNTPTDIVRNAVKDMVKKAYHRAKYGGGGIGTMPAGVERMIEESFKKPYNFRPLLKRFVDSHLFSHHESTRRKPNRRFGYVYPGRKSVMKAKVGVIGDTSGSMSEEELGMIVKNIEDINQYAQVILFEVDAAIHNITEFNPKKFKKTLSGGGGTTFTDVFKVIENYSQHKGLLDGLPEGSKRKAHQYIRDMKVLIIITDGGVFGLPKKKPSIPVMWALTRRCESKPVSWGKEIYLDNEPEKHRRY
jgi:predicted metal-dependent peptidase